MLMVETLFMSIGDYSLMVKSRITIFLRKRGKPILAILCLSIFLVLSVTIAQLVFEYIHYAALVDARLANQSFYQPAGIYAASRRVSVGEQITEAQLIERLLSAYYMEGREVNEFAAGTYIKKDSGVEIHTSDFARTEGMPPRIRITFGQKEITSIQDASTGVTINSIQLPAEILTADLNTKRQERRATGYEELPDVLIKALSSIEDRRFFSHHGIDPAAVIRAIVSNMRHGEVREGASTLTQQLVKNQILTPERTWKRKFAEAMMAIAIERRMSKQQILSLYCNRIYLGQSGLTAVYGFKQAAHIFFGKELGELSLSEAALLAGLAKSPNRYTPFSSIDKAISRRNLVLDSMVEAGHINEAEAAKGKEETISFLPPQRSDYATAPHFVDYVRRELTKTQNADFNWTQARVDTTLDLDLQQAASQVMTANLERIKKLTKKSNNGKQPEAALIAVNPQTGEILAMVGGSNYATSQFNRAADAMRQPGSAFKPVIYAAALARGLSPATTFINAQHEIEFGYKAVYRPRNFGRSYSDAPVTLRESLVRSLNVVAVDAAMQTGLGNVAAMAERMGLPRPQLYPSLALGAFEVTPIDIARAYTTFANNGVRVDPLAIRACRLNGEVAISNDPVKTTVLSPSINYLITDALADVVNRGTAARIRQMGYRGPAAGKTGTSRDAWFVGYTPKLLVVVWVGYDDNSDLKLTGGEAAVPIWTDFIKRAMELRPDLAAKQFIQPGGMVTAEICSETGALANDYCPHRLRMLLAAYMAPNECSQHLAPVTNVEETLLDLSAGTLSAEQQEKEEVLENPLITTTVSKSQAADLQFPIIKASNQVLPKERSP
jgi:penicillin-binding protein 1B